jgi:hypothetical protein
VVVVVLLDTWNICMERGTLRTLALERESYGGPIFISKLNDLLKVPKRFPKGMMSCFFRVSYVHFRVKFEFYIVKGKSKGFFPLTLWFTLKLSGQTLVVGFV